MTSQGMLFFGDFSGRSERNSNYASRYAFSACVVYACVLHVPQAVLSFLNWQFHPHPKREVFLKWAQGQQCTNMNPLDTLSFPSPPARRYIFLTSTRVLTRPTAKL
jgi:hypothetical protein